MRRAAHSKERVIETKVSIVDDSAEWERIASSFPDYCHEQTYDFAGHAARRVGGHLLCLAVRRGDEIIGAAAIRCKMLPGLPFGIAQIPSGPLAVDPTSLPVVLTAIRKELVDERRNILRVRLPVTLTPDAVSTATWHELGFQRTAQMQAYRTALLAIDRPAEQLRKEMHSKWRGHLNRSEKLSVEIEAGRSREMVSRFAALYADMRGFKDFESSIKPTLLEELSDKPLAFEVLIARAGEEDIGGHVTCWTPSVATYLLGANTLAGRERRSGYALTWRSILNARERRLPWYDLGGIDPEINPQGFEFKTRTGALDRTAAGPYEARPGGPFGRIAAGLSTTSEALYRRIRG